MQESPRAIGRGLAAVLSAAIALPLVFAKLILLVDVNQAVEALSYGLFFAVWLGFLAYGVAHLIVELVLRGRYMEGWRRWPWFTVVVAPALVSYWMIGGWVRPIVLHNPDWCRVTQRVDWPTSSEDKFILMLVGRGNVTEHEFRSGYLNWTGDEPAGISTIRFDPMEFGWWEGYDQVFVHGDQASLRARIAPSGLPEGEIEDLCAAMLEVLEMAAAGREVSSPRGRVDVVHEYPFGNEDVVLGGIVWMVLVVGLLVPVGQVTLVARRADRVGR